MSRKAAIILYCALIGIVGILSVRASFGIMALGFLLLGIDYFRTYKKLRRQQEPSTKKLVIAIVCLIFAITGFQMTIFPDEKLINVDLKNTATHTTETKKEAASTPEKNEPAQTQPAQTTPIPAAPEPAAVPYEILGTDSVRYDGAISYYVLVPPIPAGTNPKETVEQVTKAMVKDKGGKLTIYIFDDKAALEFYLAYWGENKYARLPTAEEDELMAKHNVASFSGQLATGAWPNTMDIYPSATSDMPVVGQFVDGYEFNP